MLVLTAKEGEGIRLRVGGVTIRVVLVRLTECDGRAVGARLGFEAPRSVNIVRETLLNTEGTPNGRSQ